jgi:DNA-binding NarL/FixJ family response regulator
MQIILADNQAIFRAGIARVLINVPNMNVVAQCTDAPQLKDAIENLPRSITLFPSSITDNLHVPIDWIKEAQSRAVLILEHDAMLEDDIANRLDGVLLRSVSPTQLIECLLRVHAGRRYFQRALVKTMPSSDQVGARVIRRLTPKELQIVALISEGRKNKDIANRLGTKEQVVKNYLRTIYNKIGVSDRLELALFTVHHHALAEVVEVARLALAQTA